MEGYFLMYINELMLASHSFDLSITPVKTKKMLNFTEELSLIIIPKFKVVCCTKASSSLK